MDSKANGAKALTYKHLKKTTFLTKELNLRRVISVLAVLFLNIFIMMWIASLYDVIRLQTNTLEYYRQMEANVCKSKLIKPTQLQQTANTHTTKLYLGRAAIEFAPKTIKVPIVEYKPEINVFQVDINECEWGDDYFYTIVEKESLSETSLASHYIHIKGLDLNNMVINNVTTRNSLDNYLSWLNTLHQTPGNLLEKISGQTNSGVLSTIANIAGCAPITDEMPARYFSVPNSSFNKVLYTEVYSTQDLGFPRPQLIINHDNYWLIYAEDVTFLPEWKKTEIINYCFNEIGGTYQEKWQCIDTQQWEAKSQADLEAWIQSVLSTISIPVAK